MVALTRSHPTGTWRRDQRGVSLVITLVVLVLITLASVAIISSMRSGLSASSNIAFRQAATRTADLGVEDALTWIKAQNATTLTANSGSTATHRYYAVGEYADPGCTKNGSSVFSPEQYRFSDSDVGTTAAAACAYRVTSTPSGYSLLYVVHRMATSAGSCADVGCSRPSGLSCAATSSNTAGFSNEGDFSQTPDAYYRITVKVIGPRQNNRYVQAFAC